MCPHGIEPDSRVGQVLTQGQCPALMTIDNNLSLSDFQPNSLLERGNHCPKPTTNVDGETKLWYNIQAAHPKIR